MSSIRLRATLKENKITVKMIIDHPMDTGRKKDADGNLIPKHFIKKLYCYHNDSLVMDADWGTGISRKPYLKLFINDGKAGDTVKISWEDNLNKSDQAQTTIK
ncbi:MAG: thiosulfate oxidation carrier complex protein SoxZ [Pseudomonadota bacterium]|nr:thiosulfate oxidation carrier complex protein SoxZ [Pseudomonadota bacterium]